MEQYRVTRCVCFETSFSELLNAGVTSLEEVRDQFGCSTNCGLCAPYIELMLRTGRAEFDVSEVQADADVD